MSTLYQREDCLNSKRVRDRLFELGWRYNVVCVHERGSGRAELEALSGYATVPTLYADGRLWVGADDILTHLNAHEATSPSDDEHRRYALMRRVPLALVAAREAVSQALSYAGLRVLGAHVWGDDSTQVSLTVRAELLLREAIRLDAFAAAWLTCEVVLSDSHQGDTLVCVRRPSLVADHIDTPELLRLVERADAAFVKALSALPGKVATSLGDAAAG